MTSKTLHGLGREGLRERRKTLSARGLRRMLSAMELENERIQETHIGRGLDAWGTGFVRSGSGDLVYVMGHCDEALPASSDAVYNENAAGDATPVGEDAGDPWHAEDEICCFPDLTNLFEAGYRDFVARSGDGTNLEDGYRRDAKLYEPDSGVVLQRELNMLDYR